MAETKPVKRTIWDYWAPRYDRLWVQKHSLGPSRRLVHARLDEVLPAATRFLDVGCGIGQFARELAERRPVAEVVGVDPTASMIERARRDFAHARVTYVQGTLDAIERGSGFDAITAMHSFPYVREPEAFVARLHALLRPGGRVFILNANAHTLWDRLCLWFVERTTTPAVYRPTWEIQRLLTGAGFRETAVTPLPKPFYMPSIHLVEGVA